MSFVAKHIKKVFNFTKKIVKSKVFKWIAIAAIIFFTAGVAAGGFAAFAGVNGIGSFFVAVGQTMATGAASMASSLGFQGMSSGLASHGGAAAINAGLTTSATSATGAALTADAVSGNILATGGSNAAATAGGTLTSGGKAVALSSKGLAAAQAAGNVSAAESALGMSIQPGTELYAEAASGGVTGSNLQLVQQGLVTNAPAGMTASEKMVVLSGISTGASAILSRTEANNKRKIKTFVAGGLSRGGGTDVSVPTVSFDRTQSLASQRNVASPSNSDDTRIAPPEAAPDSVARRLAQEVPQQGVFQNDRSLYRADEEPTNDYSIESILKAPPQDREGLEIMKMAEQPQYQNQNSFFSSFAATPMPEAKKPPSNFENRIFGGSILGVS